MPMKDSESQREYQRIWVQNRKANWFEDKTCTSCGSHDNLELDHINPSEKESHAIWSWSESRRQAELDKCQVLCRSCHRIKTNEQTYTFCKREHDTRIVGKDTDGCCSECRRKRHRTYRSR